MSAENCSKCVGSMYLTNCEKSGNLRTSINFNYCLRKLLNARNIHRLPNSITVVIIILLSLGIHFHCRRAFVLLPLGKCEAKKSAHNATVAAKQVRIYSSRRSNCNKYVVYTFVEKVEMVRNEIRFSP